MYPRISSQICSCTIFLENDHCALAKPSQGQQKQLLAWHFDLDGKVIGVILGNEPLNIILVANDDELGLAPGQNTFIVFALQVGGQQDQQRDLKSLNEGISEK